MPITYDVFLSHAWADGDLPQQIAEALTNDGIKVWFDATEISDFASITHAVTEGLAKSKTLLAYYSEVYPLRRACQWELTAAFLAAQSAGETRQRVLVINPQATADHIHPIELRDARLLSSPKDSKSMNQLVEAIRCHIATLRDTFADINSLKPPSWYGMQRVGSTRFIGRLQEIWKIHSSLHAADTAQITAAAINVGQVSGLGGVGKSLLAEEYALRFGAAYPGGIFWLNANMNDSAEKVETAEEIETFRASQMRNIAERLGLQAEGRNAGEIDGALTLEIEHRDQQCLWVVDDVPRGLDGQQLRRWFSPHALGRTLVTTRSREYGSISEVINLDVFSPDEAYRLLTFRRAPIDQHEREQARLLAADLGYHALALDVTGSALVFVGTEHPFKEFRTWLARDDEDVLELAKELADALPNGHQKGIAKTLLRSITTLESEGRDFLRLASTLASVPIPASLVTAVFEKADNITHADAVERQARAFSQVTMASLAEIVGVAGEWRTVHTLVSRTVRFRDAGFVRSKALRMAAIQSLADEIANAVADPRLHQKIEFDVAHAREVIGSVATLPEADLLELVAQYDLSRGQFSSASRMLRSVVGFRCRIQGAKDRRTLMSMLSLGACLTRQGDALEAYKLLRQALSDCESSLGGKDPQTLATACGAAEALGTLGDLSGAVRLLQDVLPEIRITFGCESANASTAMANLGAALVKKGRLAEARQLIEEALSIKIRVQGRDHPATLKAMNHLGGVLKAQGDWIQARKVQEDALEISRTVLEPEHPDILQLMNNIAVSLNKEGRLAESLRMDKRLLAIRERVLPPKHPDTLTSMSNIAFTLRLMGRVSEARTLQEEALRAEREKKGPEHRETLNSMNNLALILGLQGYTDEAKLLHEETLAKRRRTLGDEDRDTLESMSNVAEILRERGELIEARALCEETVAAFRRILGDEHYETLMSIGNLAHVMRAQGHLADARKMLEQTLKSLNRRPGPDHPSTLTIKHNLSVVLIDLKEFARVRTLTEQTLKARRRVLGPENFDTAISACQLAVILSSIGDHTRAGTVIDDNLRWLLDRDSSTLTPIQRSIQKDAAFALQLSATDREAKVMASRTSHSSKLVAGNRKKVGRNTMCPCGSGKKFKKCCGT